jgi:hypothetical protein
MNRSQLKFVEVTRRMSQIRPNTFLFQHDQNHLAIEKLLTLEIGLGTENTTKSMKWYKQDTQVKP